MHLLFNSKLDFAAFKHKISVCSIQLVHTWSLVQWETVFPMRQLRAELMTVLGQDFYFLI